MKQVQTPSNRHNGLSVPEFLSCHRPAPTPFTGCHRGPRYSEYHPCSAPHFARSFVLAACLTALAWPAGGQEYELRGTISEQYLPRRGQAPLTNTAAFSVSVRGNQWAIVTEQAKRGQPGKSIHETGTTNGDEMYSISRHEPSGRHVGALVVVTSNAVPTSTSSGDLWISHLWLMLASQSFFQDRTNREITPVYDINAGIQRVEPLIASADWVLSKESPHLPCVVAYRSAGTTSGTDVVYRITGTKLVGNLTLPTGFTFERLKALPGSAISCTAVVTNFGAGPSHSAFSPSLPIEGIILDRRFIHAENPVQQIVSHVPPGPWHIGERSDTPRIAGQRRRLFVAILVLAQIAVAATAFTIARSRRHKSLHSGP
jgi:hypothetical protein